MTKVKIFKMQGSDNLEISEENTWQCGGEVGFHFSYEKECGGVLSNEEARKLAEHILKVLNIEKP